MFDLVAHNPLVVIYLLQAMTYTAAATLSRGGYRKAVTVCYLASAVFRGILGVCLFLHLE